MRGDVLGVREENGEDGVVGNWELGELGPRQNGYITTRIIQVLEKDVWIIIGKQQQQ